MTNKEAQTIIGNLPIYGDDCYSITEYQEAKAMAIKALETLEEFERAQIIMGGRLNGRAYAYKCGLEDGKRKALEEEPCEDAVSREDAIGALEYQLEITSDDGFEKYKPEIKQILNTIYDVQKKQIQALPSVTFIRPKGEWETGYTYPDGVYWKCSECGELIKVKFPMNFCNSCGADMRGEIVGAESEE